MFVKKLLKKKKFLTEEVVFVDNNGCCGIE